MTFRLAAAFTTTLIVMVVLDLVWLGVIAKSTYQQGIGHLMAERPVRPAPRAASRARRNPRSAPAGNAVSEIRHRVINARIADRVRSYERQHRRGFS